MNTRYLLTLLCALLVGSGAAFGQPTTSGGAASDATNKKIHKLDLLIKIVPLVLKKSQCDALIAALDKAREIEHAEEEREDKMLAEIDPSVTDAVTNAVEKGVYPPRDFQQQVADKLKNMGGYQLAAGLKMVKAVLNCVNTSLNDGQRKTMAGSFTSSYINSSSPSSVTDEIKVDYFVRTILLDHDAYDLLTELGKHAS